MGLLGAGLAVGRGGDGVDERTDHACSWNETDAAPTDCQASTQETDEGIQCDWTFSSDADPGPGACTRYHEYTDGGRYDLALAVTDGDKASDAVTQTLEINATQLAPQPDQLPIPLFEDRFNGTEGAETFTGPEPANDGDWSMTDLAHVSAACRSEAPTGMYGDPNASLQFNRKVLFEGFLPGLGTQSIQAPNDGAQIDPAVLQTGTEADDPRGPRCTYDEHHGPTQGEALVQLGPSTFAFEETTWSEINVSFTHWGQLEPNRSSEEDLDQVRVEAKPTQARNWTTLETWEQLPEDPEPQTFQVDRAAQGQLDDGLDVRFVFEADGDFNDYQGWFVDDVEVSGTDLCPTPRIDIPRYVAADGDTTTVTLDGTDSFDRVGSIDAYEWTIDDGTTLTGPSPQADLGLGTHDVTLNVTDDAGCTRQTTAQVTVTGFPTADATVDPSATVTDHDGSGNEAITLNGSESSDPEDGDDVDCEWTDESDTTVGSQCVTNTTAATGSTNYTLTVTDFAGATDATTVEVTVEDNPEPTAATAKDREVRDANRSGQATVTLDGSNSSDPGDGEITTYEWSDANGDTIANGETATVNLSSAADGEDHNLTLEVTDDGDETDTEQVNITVVENELPQIDPVDDCQRLTCEFDANASDDTGIQDCEWELPDGNRTGCSLTHEFEQPGIHEVNVTVTDDEGETNRTSLIVETDWAFIDSFEDGTLGAWTKTDLAEGDNLWRVGDGCQTPDDERNGSYALQFNQEADCEFANGQRVSGAVERSVNLTDRSQANLTLRHHYDVESGCPDDYDEMWIKVKSASQRLASWTCEGTSDGWRVLDVSLDDYAGEGIVLQIAFDSGDHRSNDGRGWLLDQISVW
jgi:PKD repeat protein